MAVLFFDTMKYSTKEPKAAQNDRFIMSKGHACPILYAAWAEAGLFPVSELLNLRKIDNDLEGHPTPVSWDKNNIEEEINDEKLWIKSYRWLSARLQ